ncbi:MAG TPA: NAD(P)H-hydrate dehydratase [Chitinophagaceae bacterium]|nr:NAD(P)H-hydrate dehydratase [Chitinophagaceae bacterium]
MKLLSAQQIHQWDAFTIEHEPIASIDLMERASAKCTDFILERNLAATNIKIFCGKGNNGGDGLAIARQLIESGFMPSVYILEFGAKGTEDFQVNLHRLHQVSSSIYFIQSEEFLPVIEKNDLVIDALFGSGLNRPLLDLNASLVKHINSTGAVVISIDVPSGMYIDESCKGNAVVKATYTLTFQNTKLCFLLAENADSFGEVHVLDIGLLTAFLQQVETTFEVIEKKQISATVKPRNTFAHKGTYGHALLIAGNEGKMGAALLCSKACLRGGAGLVTLNVPLGSMPIAQTALPEAMCVSRFEDTEWEKYTTIGIGPGLGTKEDAKHILRHVLKNFTRPMVIDADALNILSENKDWLTQVPHSSVITPHPKEFERLFGKFDSETSRINAAVKLSGEYKFTLILKGHHTLVASNGKGWFNNTGNAGLAKGGSGDILTGLITALVCQGYTGVQAAQCGVYLHGLAADLTLQQQSQESMIATDIIEHLGEAFYEIQNGDE